MMVGRVLEIRCSNCLNEVKKLIETETFVPARFNCAKCGCKAITDVVIAPDVLGEVTNEDKKGKRFCPTCGREGR